jgi:hypothetical protein
MYRQCKKSNEIKQQVKMSFSIIKIISTDPTFEPTTDNQIIANKFLTNLYNSNQISFEITQDIEFIDQGENFESVSCDLCGHKIEIDNWQDEMEDAHQKQFFDLTFKTKCCNKKTSLNTLIYKFSAGFAKFVISISDADIELNENQVRDLEKILATKLRIITARY